MSDTTVEAVLGILAQNPRGAALVRDELSGFFAGLNQYKKKGKGADVEHYLEIWSGSVCIKDRVPQDGMPITVRHPFLTVLGTIQPSTLYKFRLARQSDSYVDDGFLDRFLFSYPQQLPAQRENWLSLSSDRREEWRRVVRALMRLKMDGKAGSKYPRDVRPTRRGPLRVGNGDRGARRRSERPRLPGLPLRGLGQAC